MIESADVHLDFIAAISEMAYDVLCTTYDVLRTTFYVRRSRYDVLRTTATYDVLGTTGYVQTDLIKRGPSYVVRDSYCIPSF